MKRKMDSTKIILNAYYERLYNLLLENKGQVIRSINDLLPRALAGFGSFDEDKKEAYLEAALSFLDERLEMYNPLGIQYTFDNVNREFARQLELQLNFFDSTEEFLSITEKIEEFTKEGFDEEKMGCYANELVGLFSAFPDRSIIEAYKSKPALNKIPDYVLAESIEDVISRRRKP